MKTFTFNSYEEFGLFFKINSNTIKDLTESQEKKDEADTFLKLFQSSKGGCPCNKNKRLEAVKNNYPTFIPSFFRDNEAAVTFIKVALDDVDVVHFKSESQDEVAFFII